MEVVPSSSPFGRVLKDHNLRERRPSTTAPATSKTQTNLQKTLQELVREHLLSSISACNENSNQSTNSRSSNNVNASKSFSVSCLVQKWRGFETHHPDQQQGEQVQNQESVTAIRINSLESDNDDSISDWESDQAPINECPAEITKKKIRVVDIMKKLPLKVPHGRLECGLRSPPRIRGRQAIADLLARLARDRYDEVEALARCHVVSKFPKRGHIQSLLKFRLLRGEPSAHSHRHHQPSKAQEFSKAIQQRLSSVNSLRRRFSKGQLELNDLASKLNQTLIAEEAAKENNTQEEINVCQINVCQINDETPEQEEVEILEVVVKSGSKNQQQNEEDEEDEDKFDTPRSNASTDVVLQDDTATLQVQAEDPPQEMVLQDDEEEEADFYYGTPEKPVNLSCGVWEEDYREEIVENEEYYDDNDYFESSLDWINDISRPHSYWESRRQAWYQEIFESSTNNDIRRLIERGSVSAVLASDFRDRMDQLMTSNVQLQMHSVDSGENEGQSRGSVSAVLTSDFRDRMDQLMASNLQLQMHSIDSGENESQSRVAFLQTQMQSTSGGSPVEDEEKQNQENEHHEQEEETISEEDVDVNRDTVEEDEEYNNHEQTPLMEEEEEEDDDEDYNNEETPLMELPWSSYQDQQDKGAANLEQIHHQESFVTNSYDHDSQVGSSTKNTIEMELISDIRAHMQQMYNEMSELRKAVNGCTDMQAKLQSSIREEVSAAISNINGKESKRKGTKKGSCCICHKKKADSLFYRCGHMCTCFECAHELQWSSGKCPICWAEIVDVVRVCTDYY